MSIYTHVISADVKGMLLLASSKNKKKNSKPSEEKIILRKFVSKEKCFGKYCDEFPECDNCLKWEACDDIRFED